MENLHNNVPNQTLRDEILKEIEAFLKDYQWSAYRFGMEVSRNNKLVKHLRDRNFKVETATRVRTFMQEYRKNNMIK